MGSLPLVLQLVVLLFLHVVLGQVEFGGLPATVTLPESSPIGAIVHNFTLENCTDPNPTITITKISPSSSFFNVPTQTVGGPSLYTLQITLSSSAALNADVVNEYILEITAQCGTEMVAGQLFVKIRDDIPEPQCEPKFSSQVGDTVQLYSNVPASSPIYVVVLRQPKYTPVRYKITLPSPSPFTITPNGNVNAPAAGFSNTAAIYQLQITVTDSRGNTCNGTLNVNVLPIYDNPINFTQTSVVVSIPENGGPGQKVLVVKAQGRNVLYEMITPSTSYYIESGTGTIMTTYNLDLDTLPSLASTVLLVRAYDQYQRSNSATVTVTIMVTGVNDVAPQCSPAVVVAQVPQDQPIGYQLADLSCTDPDANVFSYSIIPNANSLYSFRMLGSQLLINNTLNYDSFQIASVSFQYSATVVVTDNGTPAMTTNVPVFVTVTPVNNFPPTCIGPFSYNINENSPFGTTAGQLNATDADYPFNNVEFSIVGGPTPPVFYIVPRTGEIKLLGPLDYETTTTYSLRIMVVDLNNDIKPDPLMQKTNFCSITINVQDYNDNPPVCNPPFYSTVIYSTLLTTASVQQLSCSDKDVSSTTLYYTIVGGNVNNRFRITSSTVMHNLFSYNPDGVYDRTTYELLIQVTDSLVSPQYSTTATVFVTVVPWTTTQPTTVKTTQTPEQQTKMVNRTLGYWQPDVWFMVILTLTAALVLAAIALLTWALCKGSQLCARGTQEATEPLLQTRSVRNPEQPPADLSNQQPPPANEKKDIAPISPLSLQFDGRAKDPVTGRDYLFNSHTGERKWL